MKQIIIKYRYKHWEAQRSIDTIIAEMEAITLDGWELVSHNQSQYGMSVIFRKHLLEENNE